MSKRLFPMHKGLFSLLLICLMALSGCAGPSPSETVPPENASSSPLEGAVRAPGEDNAVPPENTVPEEKPARGEDPNVPPEDSDVPWNSASEGNPAGAEGSAPGGSGAPPENSYSPPEEAATPEESPNVPPENASVPSGEDLKAAAIADLLSSMTLEEKVGQMFFVRCPATGAAEDAAAYHLGGYILFGRDFKDAAGAWLTREQFTEILAGYQAAANIPLLIGVDEEGGSVARASRDPNLFPAKFQSPQAVYAAGGLEAVRTDSLAKSQGLLELGININLAPVADVSTDAEDFIYDRAFGQDAEATAEFVETAVTAAGQARYDTEDGQILRIGSVLKHFPGYGDNADTHTGVAVDERDYRQFEAEDFLPFRAGIQAGAGGVLVSHNVVMCMDPNLPASLSPEVHRILRNELEFEGVVMTDDLTMDAVEAYAEDGSVAVLAVLAGNDLIVTTDYREQIPLVLDAVRTGLIGEELVDRAVERVLRWKYDLGILEEKT